MKSLKKIVALILLGVLVSNSCVTAEAASDGANMAKVLKYYGKKNYKKASKYGKKLSKTAKEACVKKMSSKMKKAYRKIVKKYPDYNHARNGFYIWNYYLTDIDNDKKADLLVEYGSCEADVKLILYQYKKGKAKKIASTWCGHSSFHAYPNHKGIVRMEAHMGGEALYLLTLKNGKIKSKIIGSRNVEDYNDYLKLNGALKSHYSYNNSKSSITYSDLK